MLAFSVIVTFPRLQGAAMFTRSRRTAFLDVWGGDAFGVRTPGWIGAIALLLLGFAVAGHAAADTIEVCASGCAYTKIQEALDNAADGDTIEVLDPVHTEYPIVFIRQPIDSITIQGQGRDATIVQAGENPGEADDLVFVVGAGKSATLRDLHIRYGGYFQGGSILCFDSELHMERVRVSESRADEGGGVRVRDCGGSTLHDVILENNEARLGGGGLMIFSSFRQPGEVSVTDSVIRNNRADFGGGIFAFNPNSVFRLEGSEVTDNVAQGPGGGLFTLFDAEAYIDNSVLARNRSGETGGGLYARQTTVHVTESIFSHNQAEFGRGTKNQNGFVDIVGSTISHNEASIGGGGINVDDPGLNTGRFHARNSTISNNTAGEYGGALAVNGENGFAQALLANSTVADNATAEAAPFPQAITVRTLDFDGRAEVYLVNSIVANPGLENCGKIEDLGFPAGTFEDLGANVFTDESCTVRPVGASETGSILVNGAGGFLSLNGSLLANADEDGSGDVSPGDTLTFGVTASNLGEGELPLVWIGAFSLTSGPLPLDCSPPQPISLLPGEFAECTATYTVTQNDADFGAVSVSVLDLSGPGSEGFDEIIVPVQAPGLSLSTSLQTNVDEDGSGNISLGDTLVLEVTALNSGVTDLIGVFVDSTAGALDCATPQPALLAPGDALTCTASYSVSPTDGLNGRLSFEATAFSPDLPFPVFEQAVFPVSGPRPLLNANAAFVSNADEDGSGTISAGDTLNLSFTAQNRGDLVLTEVQVESFLPVLGALDCAPGQPADLKPGDELVCTASYEVTAADEASSSIFVEAIAFSAQVDSDFDELELPVDRPGVTISVALESNADEDGSGDVTPGDTLSFAIAVTNIGGFPVQDLIVQDGLDIDSPPVPNCGPPVELLPQETLTCTGIYVVGESDSASVFQFLYTAYGQGSTGGSTPSADLKLGPLQDNGGPTQTHGFRFADSSAVDLHDGQDCGEDGFLLTNVDQRGVARPQGRACDSGAFEMDAFDAVQSQLALVAELEANGELNGGQANSLTKKLEGALDRLLEGNPPTAANKLNAFINQVGDFIATGLISEEIGESMVATARWAIDNA